MNKKPMPLSELPKYMQQHGNTKSVLVDMGQIVPPEEPKVSYWKRGLVAMGLIGILSVGGFVGYNIDMNQTTVAIGEPKESPLPQIASEPLNDTEAIEAIEKEKARPTLWESLFGN